VEGVSQNIGSHKDIHDVTADKLKKHLKSASGMTYKKVKKAALAAHEETFSSENCDSKCLEKQLDEYFKVD
jgi:acetylglutamate kinase